MGAMLEVGEVTGERRWALRWVDAWWLTGGATVGAAEGEGGGDGDGGGDDGRGGGEGSIPLFWQKEIVRLIFSFIIIFRKYSKFMWRNLLGSLMRLLNVWSGGCINFDLRR